MVDLQQWCSLGADLRTPDHPLYAGVVSGVSVDNHVIVTWMVLEYVQ